MMDNILIKVGSNISPDSTNKFLVKFSNLLVAIKTMAKIKQKENDFFATQNFNNTKNTNDKNTQNNGLRKEKWKFFMLSR